MTPRSAAAGIPWTLGLLCLLLASAGTARAQGGTGQSDEFDGASLGSLWTSVNPNPASSIGMTGSALRLSASSCSDYWGGSNYSAPRVLQRVDGDWTVETKLDFAPGSDYQGAGIMVCPAGQAPESGGCWRMAERAFYPGGGGSVVRSVGGYVGYGAGTVYLRVQKSGRTYTGWYSADGTSWVRNGVWIDDPRDVAYAGLFSISCWGAPPAIADFDYFRIGFETPDVTSDLVGHYLLDGDGDDASAAGNHGTNRGGVAAADRFGEEGRALVFDETYVEVPDAPSLNLTDATVAGWFRFDRVPTDLRTVVEKGAAADYPDAYAIWWDANVLHAHVGASSGDGAYLGWGFTPTPGRWYHVAYTFDDDTDTQILYVDGLPVQAGTTGVSIGHAAFPLLIGADTEEGVVKYRFPGAIDDVRIYDRALSGAAIRRLAAAGYTVTVSKSGSGGGTVTSSPPGLDCGSTCAAEFTYGSAVDVAAVPDANSVFQGWSGDCAHRGVCTLTMDAPKALTATFVPRTRPDAVLDFSIARNPSGEWTYGWTPTRGGAFEPLTRPFRDMVPGFDEWRNGPNDVSTVGRNQTSGPVALGATLIVPTDRLHQHPGPGDQYSVVRWTALLAGRYRASFLFEGLQSGGPYGGATTDVAVLKDGDGAVPLWEETVSGSGEPSRKAGASGVTLGAGGTIDFVVGPGGNGYNSDSTGLAASIDPLHTLTVTLAGGGSGTVTIGSQATCSGGSGASCEAEYISGTEETLTAEADAGSTFGGWSGDCTGTGSCVVTLSAARAVTATFIAAPPTITGFTPASGPVGSEVTITGTNLTGATAVTFGDTAATAFTVDSATQVTATVPAGASTGPIGVTAPGGTATSASSFTVVPDADLSVTVSGPSLAVRGGSLAYTITVANAGPGDAESVELDGSFPTGLTFESNTGDCTTDFPCSLGTLAAGAQRTITTTLGVPVDFVTAPIEVTATVNSDTPDPDASNDTGSATTLFGGFFTLPPCRVADTRDPANPCGPPALAPNSDRTLNLAGRCGIPAGATAVALNVTVPAGSSAGYLGLFAADTPSSLGTLSFVPGVTVANNAVVSGSQDGQVRITVRNASAGSTHVVIDVSGYFE